jgi:hypothetical protein
MRYSVLNTIAKSTERCATQGKAQQFLKKSQDAEELAQHRERLKDVYDRFMVRYQRFSMMASLSSQHHP